MSRLFSVTMVPSTIEICPVTLKMKTKKMMMTRIQYLVLVGDIRLPLHLKVYIHIIMHLYLIYVGSDDGSESDKSVASRQDDVESVGNKVDDVEEKLDESGAEVNASRRSAHGADTGNDENDEAEESENDENGGDAGNVNNSPTSILGRFSITYR